MCMRTQTYTLHILDDSTTRPNKSTAVRMIVYIYVLQSYDKYDDSGTYTMAYIDSHIDCGCLFVIRTHINGYCSSIESSGSTGSSRVQHRIQFLLNCDAEFFAHTKLVVSLLSLRFVAYIFALINTKESLFPLTIFCCCSFLICFIIFFLHFSQYTDNPGVDEIKSSV